jgi:hypothetical protein
VDRAAVVAGAACPPALRAGVALRAVRPRRPPCPDPVGRADVVRAAPASAVPEDPDQADPVGREVRVDVVLVVRVALVGPVDAGPVVRVVPVISGGATTRAEAAGGVPNPGRSRGGAATS